MIFLLTLLDVLVNNYTKYTSFFFIIYLYNKSYKYYLITAFILDFIIFDTCFCNIIIFSIIFLLNKIFKYLNKKNFFNYIFINVFNYILFISFSNMIMINNIENILISIGSNLFINLLFYILSYRIYCE